TRTPSFSTVGHHARFSTSQLHVERSGMIWPFRRRGESVAGPESERTLALREDAELMLRAQRGNATAFAVLYERYAPQIYRYLAHRTAREDVAEDLTAEVFLNAWQAVGRYHEHGATVRA